MEKTDVKNLWELLRIFRPNDPHLRDKKLQSAWALVLAPYAVDDVRAAVAAYFREQSYWPDVTEIAARCPKPKMDKRPALTLTNWTPEEIRRCSQQMEEMLAVGALMERDYISAGLPHPVEARRMGWTARDWCRKCREAVSC